MEAEIIDNDTKAVVLASSAEVERQRFLPVMSMDLAIERRTVINQAVTRLMHEGEDYGLIAGSKSKSLLQPGAQKLDNLFGLVPRFETVAKVEDWTGADHNSEPFFYYRVKCILWRGEFVMGEGEGSCNSWESKYRWRKGERVCPKCSAENIRKSKKAADGWYCWDKTGGCGATFKNGDASIESQETGRKPNPDIHDQVNTFLKMANKRAHIAATINATSASEFFTQDMEDLHANAEAAREHTGQGQSEPEPANAVPRAFPRSAKGQGMAKGMASAKEAMPEVMASSIPGQARPWSTFKGMVAIFEQMKARLGPYTNLYFTCLEKYNVKNAEGFSNASTAMAAYTELEGIVKQYEAMRDAPQQEPETEPGQAEPDEFDKHMAEAV